MKNAFDEPIRKLDIAEKRISEFEDTLIEAATTETKEKRTDKKNAQELQDNCKCVTHM
jgi:hypothetical protein